MGRYSLLIFDLDGTLIDTAPDITDCVNVVFKEAGFPAQGMEAVKKAVGLGVHELVRGLAPRQLEVDELERLVLRFRELYWVHTTRRSRPFPGVNEALAGPLRGVRKAVLTNKPHDYAVKILGELRMNSHFELVVGGGYRDLPYKPKTGGLLYVLKETGAVASASALIGDSSVDLETASQAGVDFYWVTYGYEDLSNRRLSPAFSTAAEWGVLANGNS